MAPSFVPHNRLTFDATEVEAVSAVLQSGMWAGGSVLQNMENAFATKAGVAHAVGVASGMSALRLALRALEISTGDQVLVPAYSCVALANAVLSLGAEPIAVDVAEGTWVIDPQKAQQACTQKTKAIIAVHMFGVPADISQLQTLGIPIIEDCAHAFGIEASGVQLGSGADIAISSFYATKLLGAGEGGLVLTNTKEYAESVRGARDYSDLPPDGTRLNDKMTDIEAALALCQLQRLPDMIEARKAHALAYQAVFANVEPITPPHSDSRVWYRYCVQAPEGLADTMITALRDQNIMADRPVERWHDSIETCPNADIALGSLVSIPLYPTLTQGERQQVIDAVLSTISTLTS